MSEIYEITYWLRIDAESEKEEEKLLNLIQSFGAEIVEKIPPRKKHLAYQIDKQNLGLLGIIYFSADPESISKIRKELKLYKNILRFIIIKNKPNEQENKQEQKIEQIIDTETKTESELVESQISPITYSL